MSASALQLGSELDQGKYRIIRLLGAGAMGSVYEAEHTLTRKRVAIKWMHPEVAAASGSARLVREAQAAARVRHRNAVDVYDVGKDRETVFLVMEYLEGERLSSLLARADVPMHRVIALLIPAMRAVAAAHRQGVVHRDIKPDNIFLAREQDCDQPVPKVLDFGISKLEPRDLPHASLTHEGSAIGTPRYMSYEQLSGEPDIDGRADVYAFGVILYEALTGRPPFVAHSFSELVVKVATQQPPPPKTLRADIPSALGQLVMWALSRERAERLPSVDVFVRELEPFATANGFRSEMTGGGAPLMAMHADRAESAIRVASAPAPGRPHARPRRRGWLLACAIALLAGGAALLRDGTPRAKEAPRQPAPSFAERSFAASREGTPEQPTGEVRKADRANTDDEGKTDPAPRVDEASPGQTPPASASGVRTVAKEPRASGVKLRKRGLLHSPTEERPASTTPAREVEPAQAPEEAKPSGVAAEPAPSERVTPSPASDRRLPKVHPNQF